LTAGISGVVSASIRVAPTEERNAMEGPPILAMDVDEAIAGALFPPPCYGLSLTLNFRFEIESDPTKGSVTKVIYNPPSDFLVRSVADPTAPAGRRRPQTAAPCSRPLFARRVRSAAGGFLLRSDPDTMCCGKCRICSE
jgi:hypothetical protein